MSESVSGYGLVGGRPSDVITLSNLPGKEKRGHHKILVTSFISLTHIPPRMFSGH